MNSIKLQNASHVFTIIAAAVAAFALGFGYFQFEWTQQVTRDTLALQKQTFELERESKAVELFVKYNELMKETPSTPAPDRAKEEFWRHNLGVGIAEAIFKLTAEDEGWTKTVAWILSQHEEFLRDKGLNCATYDSRFIELAGQVMEQDVCRSR